MNSALLERLKEQHKAASNLLVSDRGQDRINRAAELNDLEERIESVQKGEPRCRNCGSVEILAHWRDWTKGGLTNLTVTDGTVQYDYDGVGYGHGDASENEEYECRSCGMLSPNLEFLLGVTEHEYTPAQYMERYAGLLHQVGLIIQDRRDRSYEGIDTPEDPVWAYLEEHMSDEYERFGRLIDYVEAEIFGEDS
jgi:hypothetical protein